MALDLERELAVQLGIEEDPEARKAVARLLQQAIHDVNGRLGVAVLRGASVGHGLEQLSGELERSDLEAAVLRLSRINNSHAALLEALADLRTLLADLSDAAWLLEEEAEVP